MNVLSPEKQQMIVDLLGAGLSYSEIARRVGVSGMAVARYRWLLAAGLPLPGAHSGGSNNNLSPVRAEQIRAMVRWGASHRQIERAVGVAPQTAQRWMQIFKEDAPSCCHGSRIYACFSCAGGVRSVRDGVIYVRFGKSPEKAVGRVSTSERAA